MHTNLNLMFEKTHGCTLCTVQSKTRHKLNSHQEALVIWNQLICS